jgi:hypothetical protein
VFVDINLAPSSLGKRENENPENDSEKIGQYQENYGIYKKELFEGFAPISSFAIWEVSQYILR